MLKIILFLTITNLDASEELTDVNEPTNIIFNLC